MSEGQIPSGVGAAILEGSEKTCLHCAIWTAINTFAGGTRTPGQLTCSEIGAEDVARALGGVIGDLVTAIRHPGYENDMRRIIEESAVRTATYRRANGHGLTRH